MEGRKARYSHRHRCRSSASDIRVYMGVDTCHHIYDDRIPTFDLVAKLATYSCGQHYAP